MSRISSLWFDTFNLISKLSICRIVNYKLNLISYFLSVLFKKNITISFPVSLSVEPTSFCNLRCPHCPTGTKTLTRNQGYLDFNDFRKVIDESASHLIYLMLYFQGEPFLHKRIIEMIKYAHQKHIYVMTSSNAQSIDEIMAEAIVKSRLDRIIISLDGITDEIYSQYRIGGEVSKVINAITLLSKYKRQLKSKTPFIEVQFLVLKQNEHQMEEMKNLSFKLDVDKLSFKCAQIYNVNENAQSLPSNAHFSRYALKADDNYHLKKKTHNKCYKMWSSAVVTWDGRLLPCCYDKDANFSFGNIRENQLKDIWKSKGYNKLRNSILKDRKSIEMCRECGD